MFLVNRYISVPGYLVVLFFKFIPRDVLDDFQELCPRFAVFASFLDLLNQFCIVCTFPELFIRKLTNANTGIRT